MQGGPNRAGRRGGKGSRAPRAQPTEGAHSDHDHFEEPFCNAYDGSSGGSSHLSDDEDDSADERDTDLWIGSRLCDRFHSDYLVYLSEPIVTGLADEGTPHLRLMCCPQCFSGAVEPVLETAATGHVHVQRVVLLINATEPMFVRVPLYHCPECRGVQHVPLLRVGYFPSTLDQTIRLGSQRSAHPLVYFHVDLMRSFCSLQNHAPALSAKAWCAHFCECAGHGIIAVSRLERLLGGAVERFRHLQNITNSMQSYGITNYPGDLPAVGSCPVCSEAVDPVNNGCAEATIDVQMDACMSFIHYSNTAAAANAARTLPYVPGFVVPVSAADGRGMFPGLPAEVPRGSKEGCEWVQSVIQNGKGKNKEVLSATCSRFAAAKEYTPEKDTDGKVCQLISNVPRIWACCIVPYQ